MPFISIHLGHSHFPSIEPPEVNRETRFINKISILPTPGILTGRLKKLLYLVFSMIVKDSSFGKKIRNASLVTSLLLTTILSNPGCEQTRDPKNEKMIVTKGGQNIHRPIREIENLEVNASLDYQGMTHKSEAEGIIDIRQLVENSNLEEEWFFIPRDKLWIEYGRNEFTDYSGNSPQGELTADPTGIEHLISGKDDIITYHIHPLWRNRLSRLFLTKPVGLI